MINYAFRWAIIMVLSLVPCPLIAFKNLNTFYTVAQSTRFELFLKLCAKIRKPSLLCRQQLIVARGLVDIVDNDIAVQYLVIKIAEIGELKLLLLSAIKIIHRFVNYVESQSKEGTTFQISILPCYCFLTPYTLFLS